MKRWRGNSEREDSTNHGAKSGAREKTNELKKYEQTNYLNMRRKDIEASVDKQKAKHPDRPKPKQMPP